MKKLALSELVERRGFLGIIVSDIEIDMIKEILRRSLFF
jgi:hypothetical protein